MKLKAVVDSLDEVDEKYRDLYVTFDVDGVEKFKLNVEGVQTHPEVTALKTAHDRTKGRVRELTGELSQAREKLDDLPDDFDRDLYDRAVEQGVGGGKIKNEDEIRREAGEAAKSRAEQGFAKERKTLTDERDRLKTRVERDERSKVLNEALEKAGVTDPSYKRGAAALLAGSLKVIETDGEYEVLAHDPDLGDIPVAEHVKAWAGTDEGKAYVGARGAAGGGANGQQPNGNPAPSDSNPWKSGSFNATEQARLKRENPILADRLRREAGL